MARLKELYNTEIIPQLMKDFSYSNVMEVPKVEKIVINMGLTRFLPGLYLLQKSSIYPRRNWLRR